MFNKVTGPLAHKVSGPVALALLTVGLVFELMGIRHGGTIVLVALGLMLVLYLDDAVKPPRPRQQ